MWIKSLFTFIFLNFFWNVDDFYGFGFIRIRDNFGDYVVVLYRLIGADFVDVFVDLFYSRIFWVI